MCSMTRQHFQFIADTLAELPEPQRSQTATLFARELKRTNSGFKPDRFLTACKVER
jgi:hypothetical protein